MTAVAEQLDANYFEAAFEQPTHLMGLARLMHEAGVTQTDDPTLQHVLAFSRQSDTDIGAAVSLTDSGREVQIIGHSADIVGIAGADPQMSYWLETLASRKSFSHDIRRPKEADVAALRAAERPWTVKTTYKYGALLSLLAVRHIDGPLAGVTLTSRLRSVS